MEWAKLIEHGSPLFISAIGMDDRVTSEHLYNIEADMNKIYYMGVDMIYHQPVDQKALKKLQTKNEKELKIALGK